ncbi:MAG: pilus assembly PilX family protein [Wenzhouxiangella sp.]
MARIQCMTFGYRRQQGAALFIALMFLLILTVLGLSSSNVAIMQERMAANAADYNLAFQRAEAVLREVEFQLSRPSPNLNNVVEWGSIAALRGNPSDCSLEATLSANWEALGAGLSWAAAPGGLEGDYLVIELSEFLDSNDNRRISCRLEDGLTTEAGVPVLGEHFLILARAFGPGPADRRARVVVQSIFWWPR